MLKLNKPQSTAIQAVRYTPLAHPRKQILINIDEGNNSIKLLHPDERIVETVVVEGAQERRPVDERISAITTMNLMLVMTAIGIILSFFAR